jgi:hypothetical protein
VVPNLAAPVVAPGMLQRLDGVGEVIMLAQGVPSRAHAAQ